MQFHWFIIPFVGSTITTITLAIYSLRIHRTKTTVHFAALMFSLSIWTICHGLSISSNLVDDKLLWTKIEYLGATAGPALWLMLAFHLTRRDEWLSKSVISIIWAWVIITFAVVISDNYHQLFWKEFTVANDGFEVQSVYGPYFPVYAWANYFMMLVSCLLFLDFCITTPRQFLNRALILALAGILPISGYLIQRTLGLHLVPHVDNTPLILPASSLLIAYVIFRFDAPGILPIARDLIIQNIQAGIVVVDTETQIIEINPFALSLTDSVDPVGKSLVSVFPGISQTAIEDGTEFELEIEKSSKVNCVHIRVSAVSDDNTIGHVLVAHDITERKLAETALERQATTDPLTGARNRRSFYELAEMETNRARRQKTPFGLIMADIDHFKRVNDEYGHQAGDEVLIEVVKRFLHCLREIDIFARYGGEEFVCLLSGEREGIVQSAERIRRTMEETPFNIQSKQINLTISFGVSIFDVDNDSLEDLISRADQALYASKKGGRNLVTVN